MSLKSATKLQDQKHESAGLMAIEGFRRHQIKLHILINGATAKGILHMHLSTPPVCTKKAHLFNLKDPLSERPHA